MTHTKSLDWHDRADGIPGRSNTRSKAPGRFFDIGLGPLYVSDGAGAVLVDADGNKYIDMLCALGAVSLGYADRQHSSSASGSYSLPHVDEIAATEAVLEHVAPWATQCKFVRTGTEALAAAVWLARLCTSRRGVYVAYGSYHGWLPWTSQRGAHGTDGEWTMEFTYGSVDSLRAAVMSGPPPAAIVVEPARWELTPPGYLNKLQAFALEQGALFIVDEMIYGGRWAIGGATELDQLAPDLACYGKALGNGAAVAMVVGGDVLSKYGDRVSGTYSGDAGCARSVIQTLGVYASQPVIPSLWTAGRLLQAGLRMAIRNTGWEGRAVVEGAPVHQRLFFTDQALGRRFSYGMATRGVLWHPDCVNVCLAHTDLQLGQVILAAEMTLAAMAGEGLIG